MVLSRTITDTCLFRDLGNPSLCEPTNAAYIAMHGHSGAGGRLGAADVPKDYRGVLLSNVDLSTQEDTAERQIEAYVKSFEKQFADERRRLTAEGKTPNEIRIKSLYLWSNSPGTGKTTTACAILQEYLLRNFLGSIRRGESPPLSPVYFLDVNAWQTEYNAFNRPRVPDHVAAESATRYYRAMDKAKSAEFAVMDDIGVRQSTEGFRGDLHEVINHRVTNEMPTVYTSNIPIIELEAVFGERRLADRIRDMTAQIHFAGDSKRGMRK